MSPTPEARTRLAAQQAALVSALMGAGEAPAEFDAARLHAASRSLACKRARAVARAWPSLARDLAQRFSSLFAAYAAVTSLPRHGGPVADGRAFAQWLAVRNELPEAGQLQALAIDLRYTSTLTGLLPRRGPVLRVIRLRQSRRVVVAMRLPLLGELWLRMPFPSWFRQRQSKA
jgi:hypothetical protein